MHLQRTLSALVLVFVATLSAWPLAAPAAAAQAAGDVSQTRAVSGFDKVRLSGVYACHITAGGRRTHVVVSGDSDTVGRVTTDVTDGTLVVAMRENTVVNHTPTITIALPSLRSITNDGAGSITISGLANDDITIVNAGAGQIVASGRVRSEAVTLNGVGKIDAVALDARDVTVDNNGVGSVHVRASGRLSMNVNGVGEIRYAGKPTHVESHVNGIGSIGQL